MALAASLLCGGMAGAQVPEGQAPAPAVAASQVSPPAAEVVKLASSGVGDDVVLAYIRNSQSAFDLNADQLLYLKDVGLSQPVITAMLDHDNSIKGQAPQANQIQQPQPQQFQQPPQQYAPEQQQQPQAPPQQYSQPAPQYAQPGQPQPQYGQPGPVPAGGPGPGAPAPAYVGSAPLEVSYFYNSLSPYGSWVDLAGVGWCWQPSAVVLTPGWRPYCNGGHWVWTDAGWFWQSDYSWGWAAFHYGRWYMDSRCGWVWLPNTTWGPAWVAWRTAGSNCGWAPLPPHADFIAGVGWRYNGVSVGVNFDFGLGVNAFAFVSFGNFCSPNVATYCLPRTQVNVIYKQTTIVNNYVVNNNTFINRGIAYDRIAAASRAPIPHATIREGAGGRPPAGGGAVVYREPLRAPVKNVNMVAQKVDMGHTIQHTTINTINNQARYTPAKYESKPVPPRNNQGSTTYFQHENQNPALKNQPNNTFNNRPVGQTENFNKTQTGTGKTSQWSNPEKNTVNPQTAAGSKQFERSTTPQGTAGKQEFSREQEFNNNNTAHTTTPSGTERGYPQTSQQQNTHWYNPKSGEQANEIHSLSKPATTTASPKTTAMPAGGNYNNVPMHTTPMPQQNQYQKNEK